MILKARYLVGFTGHRRGFQEELLRPRLRAALAGLQARAANSGGELALCAGAAEGADVLCVEVARELGISVHLHLPLPPADFANDFSSPAEWERSARQIDLVQKRPGRDSLRVVTGEPSRPECYFDEAMHLLQAVDVLLTVWDGREARGLGGTGQIVAHARLMGLPVVHLHAQSGEQEIHGDLDAAFSADPAIAELNEVARNQDASLTEPAPDADSLQSRLDQVAVREAARFRPSILRIIVLQGVASLLAASVSLKIASDHPWDRSKWILTLIELVLVTAALWMSLRLKKKKTRDTWIRCRFACEIVRSLRATVPLLDPLHPAIARAQPRWRRFAMSVGLTVLERQPTADPLLLRDRYVGTRLGEDHPESQLLHYQRKQPAAARLWRFCGGLSQVATALAPCFVLLALLNKGSQILPNGMPWRLEESPITWVCVVFFPIALPILAGVATSLRHGLDAGRRQDRYPEMVSRLRAMRQLLPSFATRATIQAGISRSEELLTDELLEWRQAMLSMKR